MPTARRQHLAAGTALLIALLPNVPTAGAEVPIDYRQLAASVPIYETSSIDKGHPWRVMYGYPAGQWGGWSLHQDWVISWLDAERRQESPGGHGFSFGTDLAIQRRYGQRTALTPYCELGGGVQYAAGTSFPANGGRWMLTLNAGVGLLIPSKTGQLNAALRWQHISNANVFPKNAGYDAVHLVVGFRWRR